MSFQWTLYSLQHILTWTKWQTGQTPSAQVFPMLMIQVGVVQFLPHYPIIRTGTLKTACCISSITIVNMETFRVDFEDTTRFKPFLWLCCITYFLHITKMKDFVIQKSPSSCSKLLTQEQEICTRRVPVASYKTRIVSFVKWACVFAWRVTVRGMLP